MDTNDISFALPDKIRWTQAPHPCCVGCGYEHDASSRHLVEQPDGSFVCYVAMKVHYPTRQFIITEITSWND